MKSELPELQNCIYSCLKAKSSYSASVLKCLTLRNIFGVDLGKLMDPEGHIYVYIHINI